MTLGPVSLVREASDALKKRKKASLSFETEQEKHIHWWYQIQSDTILYSRLHALIFSVDVRFTTKKNEITGIINQSQKHERDIVVSL
jgi:hypothetical protein